MAPRSPAERGRRAERLLLELLRPEGLRGCSEATADDLREAVALACRHALFLPVDRRVRALADAFPAGLVAGEYEAAARRTRLQHISQALRHECAEREVLALIEAAAIPSVILKGSALSRDLHGEPHCRTSSDIDLLVRPADVPLADAALREAGYRRDNDRPLTFWMRRLHHAAYRRPGAGLPVEIHWNFSIPGFFNLEPEEIWAGVELEELRGRLNPEMTLTLLLMHHHLHGCADLRTLVDLAWALEHHREQYDGERWAKRLEAMGLLVVAGIAQFQAEALWGPRRPKRGGGRPRHWLRARLLARAAGSALRPGWRKGAGGRLLQALIHRLGLDSPRRVIASFSKTLLPPAADLRALGGADWVGPAGYVRYFRWRFGGRTVAGNEGEGRPQR